MKLMIVDDEPHVREGLKHIINWEQYGFTLCAEAADGADGLAKMLALQPDLTLLDIRMPNVSGLELAAKAKQAGYSGKLIILSGHSDFAYAQQAIAHGVSSYLLKPVDEDELAEAVEAVVRQLREERELHTIADDFRKRALDTALADYVYGSGTGANAAVLPPALLNPAEGAAYSVAVIAAERESIGAEAAALLTRRLCCGDCWGFALDDMYGLVAVGKDDFLLALQHFAADTAEPLLICAECGIARRERLKRSFDGLREAVRRRRFYLPKPNARYDVAVCGPAAPIAGEAAYARCTEAVSPALTEVSIRDAEGLAEGFANVIIQNNPPIDVAKRVSAEFVIQQRALAVQLYALELQAQASDIFVFDSVYAMHSFREIKLYIKNELNMLHAKIEEATNGDIMARVLLYIDGNFHENLKLETLSALFGYNSAYFGRLFKQRTGEGFTKYIETIRIKKAQQLLLETEDKVFRIAKRVGFKNLDYFYTKFQAYASISPMEYRKRHKDAEK